MVVILIDDHGHAPAREIERNLVDLRVRLVNSELGVELAVLQYGHIQQIFQSGLIEAVDIGERQHPVVVLTNDVDVALQNDLVLRERSRLVGAEHIHRAKVLNRVEALHDRLPPRHRDRALGEVRRDDHRQHLGREADGDGEAEEQRLEPIVFREPIDENDDRHHHENEPDEQPTHLVHANVECRRRALADEALGHGADRRPSSQSRRRPRWRCRSRRSFP